MLEAYALNDEIWIEPNDSRQKGISLKITKIGRLYITAVNDWGQTYKIDRYTFQCQEFYGQAFASQQTAADYKLVQQMFRHLRDYPSQNFSLSQMCEVYKFSVFLITNKNSINPPQTQNPGFFRGFLFPFFRKNSPPPGRGLPQCVGLQGFQFLRQFQGKAR